MPQDPPNLVCLCKLHIHVTPLLKILATGPVYPCRIRMQTIEELVLVWSSLLAGIRGLHTICNLPKLGEYKYPMNIRLVLIKSSVINFLNTSTHANISTL